MTVRLPCLTPTCQGSILPTTAEDTGGYCMPCFNRRAREARGAYIRAHQKHVNLFENLTTPLEIIKTFHAVRAPDPLIIYTPYDGKISECYRALRADDTAALLDHAVGLYQANRQKEAKKIATCLLLFQSINLSPLLNLMLTQKDLEPAFLFAGAPASLQQKLDEHFLEDPRPEMDAFQCLTWLFQGTLPHKPKILSEVKSLIDTYRRPAFAVVPREQTGAAAPPHKVFLAALP